MYIYVGTCSHGCQSDNTGCAYAAPGDDTASYGNAFNSVGGGVYALEWDDEALKVWHFARSGIPDDIVYAGDASPDPRNWGTPQAVFGGAGCDADTYFHDLSLALNIVSRDPRVPGRETIGWGGLT